MNTYELVDEKTGSVPLVVKKLGGWWFRRQKGGGKFEKPGTTTREKNTPTEAEAQAEVTKQTNPFSRVRLGVFGTLNSLKGSNL